MNAARRKEKCRCAGQDDGMGADRMTRRRSPATILAEPLVWQGSLVFVAVCLDVVLFSDAVVASPPEAGGPRTGPLVIIACAGAAYGLLLFRRRALLPVLVAVCALSVVVTLWTSYRPVIPVCIALAAVIAHRSVRVGIAAFALATVTSVSWVYAEDRLHNWSLTAATIVGVQVGYLAILTVSGGIGWWRQTAERHSEYRRAEAARMAIAAERRSVARELHDIVAHAVTLMVLQSSGARAVMRTDVARAEAALDVVERTGTQAMSELRRLLAVLRTNADDTQGTREIELPPGLKKIPELIESVRAAGIDVVVHSEGSQRTIDPSVDAAAYRIVSESLTNVTKHSGAGTAAEVQLKWGPTHLDIDIWDNGRGAGPNEKLSTGNGLMGLTERIVLVGGVFEARPRDSGGYQVHAELPLPEKTLLENSVPVA